MKPKNGSRRQARCFAVQALYEFHYRPASAEQALAQFYEQHDLPMGCRDYFAVLVSDVLNQLPEIDQILEHHIDRTIKELNPVELAILRLGIAELKFHVEVPYRVVINEAIELAKAFGATDAHRYVNGVLDKARQAIRLEQ